MTDKIKRVASPSAWKPGCKAPNPEGGRLAARNGHAGRKKGARQNALNILDEVMKSEESVMLVKQALMARLRADPAEFYKGFVVPLLPREIRSTQHAEGEGSFRLIIECEGDKSVKRVKK